MPELHLDGKVYAPERLKLRKWLEFEKTQEAIQSALGDHKVDEFAELVCRVVALALDDSDGFDNAPWYEVTLAYNTLTELNHVKKIPMLETPQMEKKKKPWEYDGRDWYWWANRFARVYGWGLKEIEELDIDDAIALLQEILVDEQTEREWQWSMSEIAYPYNESTKKSEFHALERPAWMTEQVNLPATKVRFRKSMLPVGRLIGEDGSERIVS